MLACEAGDAGSIPAESTNKKNLIDEVFFICALEKPTAWLRAGSEKLFVIDFYLLI